MAGRSSAPRRSRRQRLRIVGGSRPGAAQTSSRIARGGGSSSDLQQRVGGVAVHRVGPVHHDDAPAALGRREAQEVGDGAARRRPRSRRGAAGACRPTRAPRSAGRRGCRRRRAGTRGAPGRAPGCFPSGIPASSRRANRKASVALPIPGGPVMSQAWCIRPERSASASGVSADSWPIRRGLARGSGAVMGGYSGMVRPRGGVHKLSRHGRNHVSACGRLLILKQAAAILKKQSGHLPRDEGWIAIIF